MKMHTGNTGGVCETEWGSSSTMMLWLKCHTRKALG